VQINQDKITEHHYKNIAQGKTVENADGTLSTVKTATVEYDGVTYLIPTLWDGKILDLEDAAERAFAEGVYETFFSHKEAQKFDDEIHKNFLSTTTPEEAEMALSNLEARKGIKTKEGAIMANKKFQLDEEKADLDKDGEVSSFEKAKGEAVQRNEIDKDLSIGMYHGGLMADDMMDCSPVGMDEETGIMIPPGSNAENVKDDIPAALSTGEYVLPADVVRWHGLRHIQDMMTEAKMGLMSMQMDGQIKSIEDEETEEKEEEETEEEEDSRTTPDGNVIELPEVEVEVETIDPEEEEDDEEEYAKKKSAYGYTSTPSTVFMKI